MMDANVQTSPPNPVLSWMTGDQAAETSLEETGVPSVRGQLEDLIQWCLGLDYVSQSCKDGIQTGNHYQSVRLGATSTSGFRTDRSQFLNKINFQSKWVLDLGSNLGELSRAARARGAELVDGFEYDPFFIEVAHLLNAYNSTSRVSFLQRDITQEATYRGRYDIVMAFAVWTYVAPMLQAISRITDVLLLETHNLDGNLEVDYVKPLSHFFPHYVVLGESDWGRTQDPLGRRAVLLCAKTAAGLEQTIWPTH
jgi:SAM-dependent methyltransferase